MSVHRSVRRYAMFAEAALLLIPQAVFAVGLALSGSGLIIGAMLRLQRAVMGNVAVSMAMMAVVTVVLAMLFGRFNWRMRLAAAIG